MEQELDQVESGDIEWKKLMADFWHESNQPSTKWRH